MNRILFLLAMWFIFLALMLSVHFASAQTLGNVETVGIHTLTRHDPGHGANDINFGGYVATDKGYIAGAYYNSHHRMAYYAGWSTPEWHRMKASVVGVTGYFAPVTFVLIPSLKVWKGEGYDVWISGSPVKLGEDGQSILHVSVAWSLK